MEIKEPQLPLLQTIRLFPPAPMGVVGEAGSWLEAQQGRQVAGGGPCNTHAHGMADSVLQLAGSRVWPACKALPNKNVFTRMFVLETHCHSLSLKSSAGPSSMPEKKDILESSKLAMLGKKKKSEAEMGASILCNPCLLRKGSAVIHSPLWLQW